ncbi:MAG: hypothetical protein ACLQVK_13110 [Acidimicrobiales bacterium]|jgi:hypothetical protein
MATIVGTRGTLSLPGPFYQPGDVLVRLAGAGRQLAYTEAQIGHEALCSEAAEVARCLAWGRLQTPLRPLVDSALLLRALDEIRGQEPGRSLT